MAQDHVVQPLVVPQPPTGIFLPHFRTNPHYSPPMQFSTTNGLIDGRPPNSATPGGTFAFNQVPVVAPATPGRPMYLPPSHIAATANSLLSSHVGSSSPELQEVDYQVVGAEELGNMLPDPKPTGRIEVGLLPNGNAYAPKTSRLEQYLLFPSKSSYILYFTHHYFSRENLYRDHKFLSMLVNRRTLPLDRLVQAPRLSALNTTQDDLVQALVHSKIVCVEDLGGGVRGVCRRDLFPSEEPWAFRDSPNLPSAPRLSSQSSETSTLLQPTEEVEGTVMTSPHARTPSINEHPVYTSIEANPNGLPFSVSISTNLSSIPMASTHNSHMSVGNIFPNSAGISTTVSNSRPLGTTWSQQQVPVSYNSLNPICNIDTSSSAYASIPPGSVNPIQSHLIQNAFPIRQYFMDSNGQAAPGIYAAAPTFNHLSSTTHPGHFTITMVNPHSPNPAAFNGSNLFNGPHMAFNPYQGNNNFAAAAFAALTQHQQQQHRQPSGYLQTSVTQPIQSNVLPSPFPLYYPTHPLHLPSQLQRPMHRLPPNPHLYHSLPGYSYQSNTPYSPDLTNVQANKTPEGVTLWNATNSIQPSGLTTYPLLIPPHPSLNSTSQPPSHSCAASTPQTNSTQIDTKLTSRGLLQLSSSNPSLISPTSGDLIGLSDQFSTVDLTDRITDGVRHPEAQPTMSSNTELERPQLHTSGDDSEDSTSSGIGEMNSVGSSSNAGDARTNSSMTLTDQIITSDMSLPLTASTHRLNQFPKLSTS